jgi:hypothetical protein
MGSAPASHSLRLGSRWLERQPDMARRATEVQAFLTVTSLTRITGERPAPFALPKSSNALRSIAGHSAMPLSATPLHHMKIMFAGISMPVVGEMLRTRVKIT